MTGYALAMFTVVIMATTLAISRAGLTAHLGAADLLVLRFGIGAVVLLPVLIARMRTLTRKLALAAFPLSFAHGWGMAGLSLVGLELAPASHAGALGPGCVPLGVAVVGFCLYRAPVSAKQALGIGAILLGVIVLVSVSYRGHSTVHAVAGDTFFLASSFLAATYFVYVERHAVPAELGVALVAVISGIIVVPAYLLFVTSRMPSAPWREVALQSVVQGPLMASAYLALHRAVLRIGSTPVAILLALIPVATVLTGALFTGDSVSPVEVAAVVLVSGGVAMGSGFRPRALRPS